uniref:Uncharacterized protein n=1 Tax=Myotis myotis TaxID=51298 RepID=A0A7J7Z4Q3_MYOMY|nr:hypothetical protein mMyoMyo1_010514 [Myotis myotis]
MKILEAQCTKFVHGGGGTLSQACALSQSGSTQGMSKYIFKKITLYLIFLLTSPFKLPSLLYSVSSFYLTTRGPVHEICARGRGVPSARCAPSVTFLDPGRSRPRRGPTGSGWPGSRGHLSRGHRPFGAGMRASGCGARTSTGVRTCTPVGCSHGDLRETPSPASGFHTRSPDPALRHTCTLPRPKLPGICTRRPDPSSLAPACARQPGGSFPGIRARRPDPGSPAPRCTAPPRPQLPCALKLLLRPCLPRTCAHMPARWEFPLCRHGDTGEAPAPLLAPQCPHAPPRPQLPGACVCKLTHLCQVNLHSHSSLACGRQEGTVNLHVSLLYRLQAQCMKFVYGGGSLSPACTLSNLGSLLQSPKLLVYLPA